jgi:hypothetical protein
MRILIACVQGCTLARQQGPASAVKQHHAPGSSPSHAPPTRLDSQGAARNNSVGESTEFDRGILSVQAEGASVSKMLGPPHRRVLDRSAGCSNALIEPRQWMPATQMLAAFFAVAAVDDRNRPARYCASRRMLSGTSSIGRQRLSRSRSRIVARSTRLAARKGTP